MILLKEDHNLERPLIKAVEHRTCKLYGVLPISPFLCRFQNLSAACLEPQ